MASVLESGLHAAEKFVNLDKKIPSDDTVTGVKGLGENSFGVSLRG
jgi:hypothetical protein